MFGGVDVEKKLKAQEEEERTRRERERKARDVDARGFSFSATKASFDSHIYDDGSSSTNLGHELIGFKNFAETGRNTVEVPEDEEGDDPADSWRKAVRDRYGAPQKFLDETAEIIGKNAEDPFQDSRPTRPSEREDAYKSRWRKRQLSPDRIDPFAEKKLNADEKQKKRTYAEIYTETKLDREKNNLLYEIQKKEKEKIRKEELEKRYGKKSKEDQERDNKRSRIDEYDPRSSCRGSRDDNDSRSDRRSSDYRRNGEERWGNLEKEAEEQAERKRKEENTIKEVPNFGLSGKLAEQANKMENTGIVLKWTEPPEARPPPKKPKWRIYVMKDGKPATDQKDPIILTKAAYRFGRDRNAVDIPTDHHSCSKQHAVLVFRSVLANKGDQMLLYNQVAERVIKPYLIDLASTNGTILNGNKIDDSRYYELREFDIIQFGHSTREYLLMTEDASEESLTKLT
jgi:smad nuclear-interacting protein 1